MIKMGILIFDIEDYIIFNFRIETKCCSNGIYRLVGSKKMIRKKYFEFHFKV